jgi:DNA-binding transcriptional LysR family regulator
MESLDDLHTFFVVVESCGFTAAARRLRVTPSAVSRSVRRLEARVGGALLVRSTRALALTDLGREVHAQSAQVAMAAREIDAIAAGHAGRPQGVLRVNAPVAFGMSWLTPRLGTFESRWPELEVELTLTDELVNLATARCDVALRIARRLPDGVVARPILKFDFVIVAGESYLAARGEPEDPDALLAHNVMCLGQAGYGVEVRLRRGHETRGGFVRGQFRANNSIPLVQAALAGLGIAIVPAFVAEEPLRSGRLRRLLPEWALLEPYGPATVHAVYLPTRHLPLKTRAFIDHLVDTPTDR